MGVNHLFNFYFFHFSFLIRMYSCITCTIIDFLLIKSTKGIISKLRPGLHSQQLGRSKRMNTMSCMLNNVLILNNCFLNNKVVEAATNF